MLDIATVVKGTAAVLNNVTSPVAKLFLTLLQAKEGNEADALNVAKQAKKSFPQFAEHIDQIIDDVLRQSFSKEYQLPGAVIESPIKLDSVEHLDPEAIDVVAICSRVLEGGARFIDVIGIKEEQELLELSDEQSRHLFPETGDLMGFPPPGNPRPPELNEIDIWRVQKRDVGKLNKYRLDRFVGHVYEVISIPHTSTEPDKVRGWLTKQYTGRNGQRPIFQLQDGLLIKPTIDTGDLKHLDFEQPFDAWESLVAIEWQNHVLVLGPLLSPDRKWECPPIESAVKKVLKSHIKLENFPKLTKIQIQELCHLVGKDAENGLTSERVGRVMGELNNLADQGASLKTLVADLLSLPSIKLEIEVAKSAVLDDFKRSKQDISSEIERLKGHKDRLVQELEQKKSEVKRQSADLTKNIQHTFDRAKKAGIDTLSHVALFQGFLAKERMVVPTAMPEITMVASASRLTVKELSPSHSLLSKKLAELGLTKSVSRRWAIAIELSARLGLLIAFRGTFSSLIAKEVASALSQKAVLSLDIPVGIIDGLELESRLLQGKNADAVLLRSANLSAMEAYFTPAQDIITQRITLGPKNSRPIFLASLSEGPSALPVPASVVAISFIFNTDAEPPKSFEGQPSELLEDVRDRMTQAHLNTDIWLSNLKRLMEELSGIDAVDMPAVLSLIKEGVVEPLLSILET